MGLQEGTGCEPDEIHGEGRIRILQDKLPEESSITGLGSIQHAKPLLFVRIPESQPFMELLQGNIEALTELFNSTDPGEIFTQDKEDEEQAVAGIRDNDIRKDGMGMLAAVTEYTHDAEILLLLSSGIKVNDGSAVIIMDMAVSGASTDGTGLQPGLKLLHEGIKERF